MIGQDLRQRLEYDHARRALVLAALQRAERRRDRSALAAEADRHAALRDALCQLLLLAGELEAGKARDSERNAGEQPRDDQHADKHAPHTRDVERAGCGAFEHRDRRGIGWCRRDGDRLGAGSDQRIDHWLHHGARGRRHSDDDAVGARLGGRAPAEGRVIRTPRREPIDLRAHNAPDKLGRALWQFERTEQDTRGPQL